MWQCKQCDEKIEDTFDSCWNCGKERIDDNNKTKIRDEDDTEKREVQIIEKKKIENQTYTNDTELNKKYVRNVILFYGTIPIGFLVLFFSLTISGITFLFGFAISLVLLVFKYSRARLFDNRIEFLNALDDKYKSNYAPNNLSDYKIYDSSKADFDNFFSMGFLPSAPK